MGGGGGGCPKVLMLCETKVTSNKHLKTFNTHPTKDALLNSGLFVCFFFFTGYGQVSFLFLVSWSVVEL